MVCGSDDGVGLELLFKSPFQAGRLNFYIWDRRTNFRLCSEVFYFAINTVSFINTIY